MVTPIPDIRWHVQRPWPTSLVLNDDLPSNAANNGIYFLGELSKLTEFFSVGDVKGLGLMLAAELVRDRQSEEPCVPPDNLCVGLHTLCPERGVWVRIQG